MIDKIVDHVYVSGAGPLVTGVGQKLLHEHSINRVLTVSALAVPPEKRVDGVEYQFIFALDVPNQDILNRLEEGVRFIEDSVKKSSNVLVHCEAGMSRSVTFVCAYIMRRFGWNAAKSLVFIKRIRPISQPNTGFLEQLQIFEQLGYVADSRSLSGSPKYRQWCLSTSNTPHSEMAFSLPQTSGTRIVAENEKSDLNRGNKFRCGKCRQTIFFGEHLMKHKRVDGEPCTFGYLIEPMKWMQTDEYTGKISCPSCGEKLGNYNWGGRQCQGEHGIKCCEQVIPWVHLHKNKVDEVTPRIPIQHIQRIEVPTVVVTP